MTPIAIVLYIKSEEIGRGKRQATAEAMTDDPNHDVRIVAVGFVHGPHGTIAADLAVKVIPKIGLTPMPYRPTRARERSHPRPRRQWKNPSRSSDGDG